MSFEDAALVITAWRRPAYLARVLDSWAAVPEVRELRRVTIALGRGEAEASQRAVIEAAERQFGREITVRLDSPGAQASPGMHRAIGEAAEAEFADPGVAYLILSEEDVLVSDDVGRYHAWCRAQWETSQEVLVVTSHCPLGRWHDRDTSEAGVSQSSVQLYPFFNPWCWGVWRDRWQGVFEPRWDWDCTTGLNGWDSGYDWQVGRVIRDSGGLSPNPDAARSRNIGFEGGVYTSAETLSQLGSGTGFREHRDASQGYFLQSPGTSAAAQAEPQYPGVYGL